MRALQDITTGGHDLWWDMPKAIFYLTYNGIYNFTNGIGTQMQLLLHGLERLQPTLERQYGPIHLHVVCPHPDDATWGYDPQFLQTQHQRLMALGGQLHFIAYKSRPEDDLWDVARWHTLCVEAAQLLLQQCMVYDSCLVMPIDQPWLQTPLYMARLAPDLFQRVQALLVLYSTAFIRNAAAPDSAEMTWEREGLALACSAANVAIADLCPSFTAHLQDLYHLQGATFAPYTSSILVEDTEFALLEKRQVRAILQHYGVPCDRDLVLAFGRATPLKGFETLIAALSAVRERCHFVLISVPYINDDYQNTYDHLLAVHRIAATHVKVFTRELPKALCQWPRTRIVVVPSRQETFSNIPLEVALWARQQGPIVAASRVGGFVDQIEDGVTGFFIEPLSCETMGQTLQQILNLSEAQRAIIRRRAYEKVVHLYNFAQNFPATLRWFWGAHTPRTATAGGSQA
jgi:glycosyltransferase involved in cell wall biosynthesis